MDFVIEKDIKDINRAEIVKYMVGRELIEKYPYQCCKEEDIILMSDTCALKIKNINFTLRRRGSRFYRARRGRENRGDAGAIGADNWGNIY